MAVNERAAMTEDEQRLHEMGYAQELRRRMSGFSNFAVSFTIISILSGCMTLYGYGMITGGPVAIVWGWPFVGIMTLMVGLSMAEVCSSFPTAGGLYYWAAKLARDGRGPVWAWFTGWFNFLGQVAITAGIDFGAAFFANAWLDLVFQDAHLPADHHPDLRGHAAGAWHHEPVRHPAEVALLNNISVWWHILGMLLIIGMLAFGPHRTASPASFVFTEIVNLTGFQQHHLCARSWPAAGPVHLITIYDASAHMTEETHSAARSGLQHRDVHHRLPVRRLGSADRPHLRHPALRRLGRLAHRRAARPDLHRRPGRDHRQGAAAGGDRCPAVLRHVLGHRELADDLRVLPRRRAARLELLAPGQQADQDADQRDLALAARSRLILDKHDLWNGAAPCSAISRSGRYGLYIAQISAHLPSGCARNVAFPARPLAPQASGAHVVGWIAIIWVIFITSCSSPCPSDRSTFRDLQLRHHPSRLLS